MLGPRESKFLAPLGVDLAVACQSSEVGLVSQGPLKERLSYKCLGGLLWNVLKATEVEFLDISCGGDEGL